MLILVIDDDDLSRELLTLLLEADGYNVVAAASGNDGLLRLRSMDSAPGAVLTDLQMPGISGTELAHALRALLPAGIPVVAMSGSDSKPAGALDKTPAGFDGFLLKPFPVEDLRVLLANFGADVVPGISEEMPVEPVTVSSDAVVEAEAEPALNDEVFHKMLDLMPAAQLEQMYGLCIQDARTRMAAMRTSAAAGDDASYRSEAHAIKGGAGMIGAAEIYHLASKAEKAGLGFENTLERSAEMSASVGISGVTALIDQLSRACERLERILVERLHA